MGEVNGDSDGGVYGGGSNNSSERVHEWEAGLPDLGDITPLTQGLIPPELLSAFNIKPEPHRTTTDVAQASQQTIASFKGGAGANFTSAAEIEVVEDDIDDDEDGGDEMSEAKKPPRNVSPEDADSAAAVKRPRLVWTPQLHKRFVEVVAHLGIKTAVPKTIMQLMNVEGLTRENVASHLQKYRLYLKRMQGVNFDSGPSNSPPQTAVDTFTAAENGGGGGSSGGGGGGHRSAPQVPVPVPIPMPMMMPMMGSYNGHQQNYHHHQQNFNNNHYNYFQNSSSNNNNYQYNNGVMQSGSGNKYGGGGSSSVVSYHHQNVNHHNYPPHVDK